MGAVRLPKILVPTSDNFVSRSRPQALDTGASVTRTLHHASRIERDPVCPGALAFASRRIFL